MPFSSEKKDEVIIRIEDTEIENSEYEKLLGIKVDAKRNFYENWNRQQSQSKSSCVVESNASYELSKKKEMMNSSFNSQFSYYPLVSMFHSRIINNKLIAYMAGACVYKTGTNRHIF